MIEHVNDLKDPRSELLTDAEISAIWPISMSTIARQRRLGAFPEGVRIGRLRRTPKTDVVAYFTPPSARRAALQSEG